MRAFYFVLLLAGVGAADWRQWRGFSRNGLGSHKVDFEKLPAELTPAWSVAVGTGYAAPIVAGERVFTFTRQRGREVVQAFDRSMGKPLWKADYAAPFTRNRYANEMQDGPFATPLVYNNTQLITWGVSGILSCFDAASGRLQWRNDYSMQIKTDNLFTGVAASPIGNNGRIYLHMGDDRGGRFLALDARTGRSVWSTDPGAGPGYSSPVIHNYRGVSMLITLSNSSVIAVAENDGRLLWSHPFRDQWLENIVTPLVEQDRVLVSGVRNGTHLLRIELQEDKSWKVSPVWQNAEVTMYMSSAVLDGDTVYAHSARKKGQFVAMSFGSGKLLWQSDGRDASSASLIQADNAIIATSVEGDLLVLRKDKEKYDVARKYKLTDSAVWAHTALAGGEIFIKDETHLRKFLGL
ncbi:MAG: PQQ-binding-like beta-propeller repeat protein [Bryobacteraceae bacterium]